MSIADRLGIEYSWIIFSAGHIKLASSPSSTSTTLIIPPSTRIMSTDIKLQEKTLSELEAKPVPLHKDAEVASVSEVDRKKVLRKMDIYLLPFVSFLYLLSFL